MTAPHKHSSRLCKKNRRGGGKGEKVVQETTSCRVIGRLFHLGAASSCKPLLEGCPPETEGRTLETHGDVRSR